MTGSHSSYLETLRAVAGDDSRYAPLVEKFNDRYAQSHPVPESRYQELRKCKGEITLLALHENRLVTHFSATTRANGNPKDISWGELNANIESLWKKPYPGNRILIFKYDWLYDDPQGLNFALLDRVCVEYQAFPELLLPHFELELGSAERLPSQHRVLLLAKQRTEYYREEAHSNILTSFRPILCTAQLCSHVTDSENKLILMVIRSGLENDRSEAVKNNVHALRTCTPGIYHRALFNEQDSLRGPPFNEDPSIEALQRTVFEDLDALRERPFEVLLPVIRVFCAAHLSSIEVHRKYVASRRDANESSILAVMEKMDSQLPVLQEMLEVVENFYGRPSNMKVHPIIRDAMYVVHMGNATVRMLRDRLNYLSAISSIEEARSAAANGRSVKRLTQLAFIFIPLGFITSTFGMNVDVLIGTGAKWWTVLVGIAIIYALLAVPLIVLYGKQLKWRIRRLQQKIKDRAARKSRDRADSASRSPSMVESLS